MSQRRLDSFFAQPLSAEQQARAAEVAARVALKQAAEDRRAKRLQCARTFLQARFGVSERREPGRPSKAEERSREQVEVLVVSYTQLEGDDRPPEEWFGGEECRALCSARGWTEVHAAAGEGPGAVTEAKAAGEGLGAATDGAARGAAGDARGGALGGAARSYNGWSKPLMAVYNSWSHVWASDGSHVGWRTTKDLVELAHTQLGDTVAYSSAARWLAAEKQRYAAGGGVREKPNLAALIKAATAQAASGAQPAEDFLVTVEPPQAVFGAHLYPALQTRCESMVDIAGFGVDLVAAFASELYHDDLCEADVEMWYPSVQWCCWFMHEKLGLVPRRITSHDTASLAQVAIQERLHALNVDFIEIARHEGLLDKYIMGSDEFGQHLFPYNKVKWDKKGVKHVSSDLPEDKRQYTGDVVHNMAGQVVSVLQIWAGKTATSLPPGIVRERHGPLMRFDMSVNHWANHDTKLRLLKHAWQWVCNEWKKDGLPGQPRCIYLLDCWPVNLTEKLRNEVAEACPGMILRFIPAGATGKYQVNNTHVHKPLKSHTTAAAQRWRVGKIIAFRKERDATVLAGTDAVAADERLTKRVQALMKVKVLRSMSPDWLMCGVQAVLKPIASEGGRNVIRKGWEQLYIEPAAAAGGWVAAYTRKREREEAEVEAEVQRRVEAAQAAAAVPFATAPPRAAPPLDAPAPFVLEALVAQVARAEQLLHEGEVPKVQPRWRGKGATRHSRVDARDGARKSAMESATAAADAPAGAGGGGDGGLGHLDGLSVKDLKARCAEKQLALYGTKAAFIARLQAWKPGTSRSKRGRPVQTGPVAKKAKATTMADDQDALAAEKEEAAEESEGAEEAELGDEEEEEDDESEDETTAALLAEAAAGA